MDEYLFNERKRTNVGELKPNYDRVKTIEGELSLKGEFEMIIRNKNRGIKAKFIIMKRHIDNLSLIGRDTLIELDMMILEPTGNNRAEN